jgi:hypothetical protein
LDEKKHALRISSYFCPVLLRQENVAILSKHDLFFYSLRKQGDQVLLRTKELLDTADIGKLSLTWDGTSTVTACPSPNFYTLVLLRKLHCSSTVNVDCLKPFFERAGMAPAPGPISYAGQEDERWSCCSSAGWCAAACATSYDGWSERWTFSLFTIMKRMSRCIKTHLFSIVPSNQIKKVKQCISLILFIKTNFGSL